MSIWKQKKCWRQWIWKWNALKKVPNKNKEGKHKSLAMLIKKYMSTILSILSFFLSFLLFYSPLTLLICTSFHLSLFSYPCLKKSKNRINFQYTTNQKGDGALRGRSGILDNPKKFVLAKSFTDERTFFYTNVHRLDTIKASIDWNRRWSVRNNFH